MLIHHLSWGAAEYHMAAFSITQSTKPSEYRSERVSTPAPANCSGLANSAYQQKFLELKSQHQQACQVRTWRAPGQ